MRGLRLRRPRAKPQRPSLAAHRQPLSVSDNSREAAIAAGRAFLATAPPDVLAVKVPWRGVAIVVYADDAGPRMAAAGVSDAEVERIAEVLNAAS